MYILTIILWLLSIATSTSVLFATGLYSEWYFILIFVAAIPVLYIVWFLIFMLVVTIISLFLKKTKDVSKPSIFYYQIIRQFFHQVFFFGKVKVKFNGLEKLPLGRALYVSNHLSGYDSLVLLDKFKKQPIIPVSKIELRDLPVVGPLMVNAGYLILDRDNPREAVKTFNKAQNYINNDWSDVYICPEGTRSKTGEILPFHPGSFKIAYKANCPIVVMNLTNCNKISKNLFKRKTVAIVDILDVIYPEDFKSINTSELAEKTRNMIIDFQQNN
jgi:1-acyl-sn-glycerol-3-phosphate acyltransferase